MKLACALLFAAFAFVGTVSAIDFSQVQVSGKRITICRVNLRKDTLQLFSQDDANQPIKRFDRLKELLEPRGQTLLFAMNGGMYHGDFSPVGLFVSDGKQLTPLNTSAGFGNFFLKPNGVFLVSETGAKVVESSEYAQLHERVILATQSGPLLVHAGRIHPSFIANSQSRLIRNGVGVVSPDIVVFAITEDPVNLYEFASFFRDTLHCPNALFLDGSVSSLYSEKLHRSDFRMDLGPIIAVTSSK